MRQFIFLGVLIAATSSSVSAQMVTTQMPLQHQGASFYEYSHVGWSVHNPHYFMTFGAAAPPPFGGYQSNGGFATGNAHFNFGLGQGASYTSTSVTPMLTTTDGYPGYLFIGSQRPFVTGVTPVVGGGVGFTNVPSGPLSSRVATGQLRLDQGRIAGPALDAAGIPPAPDVEVRRPASREGLPASRAGSKSPRDLSAQDYLDRGNEAVKTGRAGVAKIYYQLASTKGDALVKAEAIRKLEELNR